MIKKTWIVIGLVLITVGIAVSVVGVCMGGVDFDAFHLSGELEKKEYNFSPHFGDTIKINAAHMDVNVECADVNEIKVECNVFDTDDLSVEVEDGVLYIKYEDLRPWFMHVGVWLGGNEKINVKVPKIETFKYEYSLNTQSGGISVCKLRSNGNVEIESLSGSIHAEDINAKRFEASSTSGEIELNKIAADSAKVNATSGSVSIMHSNMGDAELSATGGSLNLKSCDASMLSIHSSSGSLSLDHVFAPVIEANTSSGSIKGKTVGITEYGSFESTSGSINITLYKSHHRGYRVSGSTASGGVRLPAENNGEIGVFAKTTSGSIHFEVSDRD